MTVSAAAAVSRSPTVKASAPVGVSSAVVVSTRPAIVGASFTGVTVRTKVAFVVAVPSLTATVIVAAPDWFAAGVAVSVRLAPLPPRMRAELGMSAGLEEVAVTVSVPAADSRSPTVNASAAVGVSSAVVVSIRPEIVGASFTGVTVRTKVAFVVTVPSLTATVMVAVPDWFAAGVAVSVRLAPLPPRTRLPFGTRAGFDDVALTVRLPTSVSASPTVKPRADVGVSSVVVVSTRPEIVGASFTAAICSVEVAAAEAEPSLTVIVRVLDPCWFAAGR